MDGRAGVRHRCGISKFEEFLKIFGRSSDYGSLPPTGYVQVKTLRNDFLALHQGNSRIWFCFPWIVLFNRKKNVDHNTYLLGTRISHHGSLRCMGSSHGMLLDQPSHERIIAWWKFATQPGWIQWGSLQTKWAKKKRATCQGCLVGFLALIPPPWDLIKKSSKFDMNVAALKKRNISISETKPCKVFHAKNTVNISISETLRNYQKDLKQESRETPPFQSNSPFKTTTPPQIPPPHSFPRSQKNKMETKNTAHHDDTAVPGQSLWIGTLAKLMGGVLGWCYFSDGPMTYFGSCEAHVSHEKKNLLLSIESWLVNKGSLYYFIIIPKKNWVVFHPLYHPNHTRGPFFHCSCLAWRWTKNKLHHSLWCDMGFPDHGSLRFSTPLFSPNDSSSGVFCITNLVRK